MFIDIIYRTQHAQDPYSYGTVITNVLTSIRA